MPIKEKIKNHMKEHYPLVFISKGKSIAVIPQMVHIGRERESYLYHAWDYIRVSQLELMSKEIYENHVEGSVAELGVYRGEFAKYINQAFPDRSLYLFDTFEGFDARDAAVDQQQGYSGGNQDFSKTGIPLVLSKMAYPENCIIKQGYFPNTADDVACDFAFVSIDCDLYAPIYAGLSYFYPRLRAGGVIFVHDYNSGYKGSKTAVTEYCNENHISFIPISDSSGSVVVRKP